VAVRDFPVLVFFSAFFFALAAMQCTWWILSNGRKTNRSCSSL